MRSPKQANHEGGPWYPYYAGYTPGFARDALELLVTEPSVVLDPWNGSGTTTSTAFAAGHTSIGIDANPALVLIARGRNVAGSIQSLRPLAVEILHASDRLQESGPPVGSGDPLATWFKGRATTELRYLNRAINEVLVGSDVSDPDVGAVSDLAAFFHTAGFETVRGLLRRFRSTNPTWIREPADQQNRLNPERATIRATFLQAVGNLSARLARQADVLDRGQHASKAHISLGDSRALDIDDDYVDAVLTSPPYCTRIDYVISARAELAYLGFEPDGVQSLRQKCVGAPLTTRDAPGNENLDLAPQIEQLLERIGSHDSAAASTYYLTYFTQYFTDMTLSLGEIDRVMKPGGTVGIVVQDSYFKDIHVDLQGLTQTIMAERGWELRERHDFSVRHSRSNMNPRAQKYAKPIEPRESLLLFQ